MSRAAAVAFLGALLVVAAPAVGQETALPAEEASGGPTAVVETPKGSFTIRLLPDVAPKHVAHFVETAKAGGFDGTTFHRIIMGGIIQGGDPLSKDPENASRYGTGGLDLLKAEFSDLPFVRGDVNQDGRIDIGDPIRLLAYLFAGARILPCFDAADANDDERMDIADAIAILTYLFGEGGDLPPPVVCGPDPSGEELDCRESICTAAPRR